MSEDLENTLMELGPEYAGTVARLRGAREAEPSGRAVRVLRLVRLKRFACAAAMFAAAAGLLWVLGVDGTPGGGATACGEKCPNPYSLAFETPAGNALKEIKRTQNPDGSWISDHLTRQNAAVLRKFDVSSVACRKALRYLRSRGLEPFTDAEFRSYKAACDRFNSGCL
jgi:hypothetical protein